MKKTALPRPAGGRLLSRVAVRPARAKPTLPKFFGDARGASFGVAAAGRRLPGCRRKPGCSPEGRPARGAWEQTRKMCIRERCKDGHIVNRLHACWIIVQNNNLPPKRSHRFLPTGNELLLAMDWQSRNSIGSIHAHTFPINKSDWLIFQEENRPNSARQYPSSAAVLPSVPN